jgi:transcriptional regulator with XRE-family HTH domain
MISENWFLGKLEEIKDDPEYITDRILFEINEEICETLKRKNWTQKKFANELNVSEPYITKLLRGKPNLTIESLVKITLKLGLKLHIDLFEKETSIIKIQDECKDFKLEKVKVEQNWIETYEGEIGDVSESFSKAS